MHAEFNFQEYDVLVLRKTRVNIVVKLIDNSFKAKLFKLKPKTYIGRIDKWLYHPALKPCTKKENILLEKIFIKWKMLYEKGK